MKQLVSLDDNKPHAGEFRIVGPLPTKPHNAKRKACLTEEANGRIQFDRRYWTARVIFYPENEEDVDTGNRITLLGNLPDPGQFTVIGKKPTGTSNQHKTDLSPQFVEIAGKLWCARVCFYPIDAAIVGVKARTR